MVELLDKAPRYSYIEYKPWCSMWHRCTNPKDKDYLKYKDKAPPDRWKDFYVFVEDMGPRPSKAYTIERIDNNLGYSPVNCKWASRSDQQRNTSQNRWFVRGSEKLCLTALAEKIGITNYTLRARLDYLKWPLAKAVGEGWVELSKSETNI